MEIEKKKKADKKFLKRKNICFTILICFYVFRNAVFQHIFVKVMICESNESHICSFCYAFFICAASGHY